MEEFLRDNNALISTSLEFIAAVTGLFCLKKFKGTAAVFFIYFLCFIAIADLLGWYSYFVREGKFLSFLKGTYLERNYWWTTVYWIIGSILFYSYYYSKIISTKNYLLVIKIVKNVFLYFSIIYIALHWDEVFIRFFPIIDVIGALVIFICVALYFIETLSSNKILRFYKSVNFYISTIILIWWLIITPLIFYDIYFSRDDWSFVILKWQIYLFANCFMYLTFTFALLWCDPKIQ